MIRHREILNRLFNRHSTKLNTAFCSLNPSLEPRRVPKSCLSSLGCIKENAENAVQGLGQILKETLEPAKRETTLASKATEMSKEEDENREAFDYFVVVDFEATCDSSVFFPQEIIEFPSVLIAVNSLTVQDSFQTYVKPVFNPQLTEFCKRLTGIEQSQVDSGMALADALEKHDKWLEERGVKEKKFGVITWTDWDCKVMLEFECKLKGLTKPPYFNKWINLKSLFQSKFGEKLNLRRAVLHAGLQWEGREHCGLDDAKNTASLAVELIRRGVHIGYTDTSTVKKTVGNGSVTVKQDTVKSDFLPKLKKILDTLPKCKEVEETNIPVTASDSVCYCGVKCKARLVRKAGPNQGKLFLSCGNWSLSEGGKCTYFEWTSAVETTADAS